MNDRKKLLVSLTTVIQVFFDNQVEHARDFEEGRYFPITKAMEE